MEIKDLIHKKIKVINYFNEYNSFPMFEYIIDYINELDDFTVYELIKDKFLNFLKNEDLSFDINNFKLFEMIFMEELEKKFKRLKIDYKYIDLIKEEIFKNSKL